MALPEPDANDVGRARGGDGAAFENIVRRYRDWVYRLAYRMVYDADEARDLSQEVFLRLYKSFDKFDLGRPFGPWFFRLATNVCLNACKKRKKRPVTFQTLEYGDRSFHPPGREESSPEQVGRKDAEIQVRYAVEKLPPAYRLAISLRYLKELSYEEMAELLDVPLGTVKNRLFRAREKLKALLTPEGAELSERI
ncbi:MAG: RNA polymerase sigma factor [Planctomycetota bacterium]|jgi:RNA polymerase sigma-70 factor (ECF subfamily)